MTWLLKGQPFQVQSKALEASKDHLGYLYLMEQGLGKTAVVLADFLRIRDKGWVDTLVVVCPNSLKSNWIDEAEQWGTGLDLALWPLAQSNLAKVASGKLREVIKDGLVLNYESLTIGTRPGAGGLAILGLAAERRVYLVLDECHRIKTPTSNVTKFVLGHLLKVIRFRRGCTGTPYGNNVLDLYPQFRLAGMLNGMNPYVFRNKFAVQGGFKGKQIVGINKDNQAELFRLIDECGFRALKADWTDIPPKLYRTIRVGMSKKLDQAYSQMKADFVLMLDDQVSSTMMIISQMIKLQQISSGFVRTDDGTDVDIVPFKELEKSKALLDVLDANGTTSKTIVFCLYSRTVRSLVELLQENTGETPSVIRGGMTAGEIKDTKAGFNSDDGPAIIIVQIQAGKEGHTLLGGTLRRCSTVLFFENNYSYIDRAQCEDRAHRFGQKSNLLIIDTVSSPIEQAAVAALQGKKDVATSLLDARRLAKI